MTVLAGDFGGTRVKLGVLRDGRLVARATVPAQSHLGLAPLLPRLQETWMDLLATAGIQRAECSGIAIAFPSIMDPRSGRVLAAYGKYTDAPGMDLRAWAMEAFGLPLAIENDARMALIGEWQAGAGRGCDNFVMMTLGTGLGTSALVEGRVLRGVHGQAGILGGHFTVRYSGSRCTCGNVGCAEAEASTASLRRVAEADSLWPGSALRRAPALDYEQVFTHAAAGDPCAVALRDRSLQIWGTLAVNLIHAYDPELLVVGGGIMAGADTVLPALSSHLARHAHTPWGRVRIVPAALGDSSALHAAGWLLQEQASCLAP